MSTAPALPPELAHQSISLARALSAAVRNWGLYPPEHPAVNAAVRRLADAVRQNTAGAAFTFAITPTTLLVAGMPLPEDQSVTTTARLLHDRDVLQLTFLGDVPVDALRALLTLLTTPVEELRREGGPAKAWEAVGQPSIALDQIDYEKLLEDREVDQPASRHDDIWRSLVNTLVQGQDVFDERQQQRLLKMSGSAVQIGELASAVIAPKCNIDGSPLIITQAATVLAVYRRLAGIVTVMEPERLSEVMQNIAASTTSLDPHVALQMMQTDDRFQGTPIMQTMAASFNDATVAELLARALGRDGRASARLAQVFDTIVPDEERKRRVLTMTRSMLTEQDFGAMGQLTTIWAAMEELLLSYNDTQYVSASYRASLDGVGDRAEMLARRGLPPELSEWIESLRPDNVRSLSVRLISDLLRIEDDAERAAEVIRDMGALLEDLFLAGDFPNAVLLLRDIRQASERPLTATAARSTLTAVGTSAALRDTAALLADLDAAGVSLFTECCELMGPTAIDALSPGLRSESPTRAFNLARGLVERFGADAIGRLLPLVDDTRWFVQRNAALLLGAARNAAAVPPLLSLLRRSDTRVLRHAVAALAGIDDPSAARGIQAVLRATTGANRAAVVEALVAERDPRVVPLLARILAESDPFGQDHQTVLDALDAIRQLGVDEAVASVAVLMKKRRLFARKKARAFKTASVRALLAIGTPQARAALDDAVRTGDRLLRKIIRTVRT